MDMPAIARPRWRVATISLLACVLALAPDCTVLPEPRPPNFVVIFVDDMGYGDIGPFGSVQNRTPELDRMAEEGLKLTSFYAAAPVCTPSRAALLTGAYPKRVGLATGPTMGVLYPGDPWGLHPDETTVAEILRERGYSAGCFGKWHLGDQPEFLPTRHGFDEFFGIPYSNDMWPFHVRAPEGGIYDFPPLPLMRGERVIEQVRDMRGQAQLCRRVTDAAVDFIRRNKDRPFFAYVPHAFIHHPRAARPAFMAAAGEPEESVDWTAITAGSRQWHCDADGNCRPGTASPEAWAELVRRRTKAQIEEVDWSVGAILGTLRDLGIERDTLVLFTSDNGGASGTVNAPLRGGKGSTWEGGMRVPALVWWPGSVPAGATVDAVTTTMDLLPTFARLAGGAVPEDRVLDGRDIAGVLRGAPDGDSGRDAFYYYRQQELQAVRSGRWKLFRRSGELFDLDADIGETDDVSDANPAVVAALSQLLDKAVADLGDGQDDCPRCRPVGVVSDPRVLVPGGRSD